MPFSQPIRVQSNTNRGLLAVVHLVRLVFDSSDRVIYICDQCGIDNERMKYRPTIHMPNDSRVVFVFQRISRVL